MAFFRAILISLLLGLTTFAVAATPLRDYAAKVKDVQFALESLRQEESGVPVEETARSANIVAYARRKLPANETITGPDGPFAVNNEWLAQELDEYEELERGSQEADAKLENIAHRLAALRDRLEETQRAATAANAATKDEQKGRLESILRRPEFSKQKTEENALARLTRRIWDWIKGFFPQRAVPVSEQQISRFSPLAQVIIFVLLLGALGFAAWRVGPLLRRGRLRCKDRKETAKPRIVLGEKLAPDQTGADLFREAEDLARQGELRAAIRKGYIALLCELGDRKAVRLEQHKTNYDYLRDVAGEPALYQPLRQLTSRFEYHWYGLAPAQQSDWDEFRQVYQGTLK